MDGQPGGHVVAACGEASIKVPVAELKSASYSTPNSPPEFAKSEKGLSFQASTL
jgi:hypothetical protein